MNRFLSFLLFFAVLPAAMLPAMGISDSKAAFKLLESRQGAVVEAPAPVGTEYVIPVTGQTAFDNLASSVRKAVKAGETRVVIRLSAGRFFYKNNHLNLSGIDNDRLFIRIEGNGAVLIPAGNDYRAGSKYTGDISFGNAFLSDQWEPLSLKDETRQGTDLVEVVDEKTKLCRLKTVLPDMDGTDMQIRIPQWYTVSDYPVQKISKGYIYFTAGDLAYLSSRKCYNVNYDYALEQLYPRYAVYNVKDHGRFCIDKGRVYLPAGIASVHECTASEFLVLYKNRIRSFEMRDIQFVGSGSKDRLLYVRANTAARVLVTGCTFRSIRNTILGIHSSDNVCFVGNTVEDCSGNTVDSAVGCKKTIVRDNTITGNGGDIRNNFCITCYGEDFYIADNRISDFGYCAIRTGYHYKWKKSSLLKGIIENNEIWFSDSFATDGWKYTLMDGGAVYVSTQNDETIIRYNNIHDIAGVHSFRGIYCDDGTQNTAVYGNVVRNIKGSYTIFLRRSNVDKYVPRSNDGNIVMYNIVDGPYKFEGRKDGTCIHGSNLVLSTGNESPKVVLNTLSYQEKDIQSEGALDGEGRITVSSGARRQVKSLPCYAKIKQWIN